MYNLDLVNEFDFNKSYFKIKKECKLTYFIRAKIEKEIEDDIEDLIYERIGDVIQEQLIMKD